MVKYSDILKAINKKIKEGFDKPIISSDVSEGFERPSFFTDFSNIKSSDFMDYFNEKKLSVVIYFFPSDRYKNQMELMETTEKLEELFLRSPILVGEGTRINIDEVDVDTTSDKVLMFSFDIETFEEYDIQDGDEKELMESLEVNLRKGD